MKVYVVTVEDKYNDEFYVVGVYPSMITAEEAIEKEIDYYEDKDYSGDELEYIASTYNWHYVEFYNKEENNGN